MPTRMEEILNIEYVNNQEERNRETGDLKVARESCGNHCQAMNLCIEIKIRLPTTGLLPKTSLPWPRAGRWATAALGAL